MTILSKNKLQSYFRQRWENVFLHFSQFERHTSAEHIHRIRVELKKIRLLLYLEKNIHGKKHADANRVIRRLFRMAGDIREAQIAAQLVRREKSGSVGFFTEHRNAVAKASHAFVEEVNRHTDQLVKANTALWRSLHAAKRSELNDLTGKLIREIKLSVYPVLKKRSLHEARKLIKRLVYLHGLLRRKDAHEIIPGVAELKLLEKEIGEWHDAVVTMQLMRKFPRASRIKQRLKHRADIHLKRAAGHTQKLFGNKKGGRNSRLGFYISMMIMQA